MKTTRVTRRSFLTRSLAAAGALGGVPLPARPVPAADNAVPPSKRVTLGCIGLGIQGTQNMRTFLGHPEVRVLAVCDVHETQRDQARDLVNTFYDNSDCAAYRDFRELLARPDIDAVLIATPDHWHALIGAAAARQRKHMYMEKPVGWSFTAAHALEKAVREAGVVFQFGTQQRSSGNFRFACELVRNGRIGQLQRILVGVPGSVCSCPHQPVEPVPKELDYDLWLGPAPLAPYCRQRCRPYSQKEGWSVWYGILDYCLGMIANWGVHHLDIAQWGNNTELSGPVEIEGRGVFPPNLLTDAAIRWEVDNRYANGVTLTHMDDATSQNHPRQVGGHGHGVMFQGTEGWVHVDRQKLETHPASLLKSTIRDDEVRLFKSDNHHGNFISAVKGQTRTAAPVDVAVRTDTLCNLQHIAVRLQRKLRWDPVNERFLQDDEANALLDRPMRAPWKL